jgi:hypothetical protein
MFSISIEPVSPFEISSSKTPAIDTDDEKFIFTTSPEV